MRCARSSVLAGLLLVAAGTACGAEGAGGTLDETKRELRQLQADQKNKAGQPGDKLKLATPAIEIQAPESANASAWLSDKLLEERKLKEQKAGKKNWLVDGVEKLEKESAQAKEGTATGTKESTTSDSTAHEIDQSDPQYLLKLFDEQKKTTDGKSTAGKSSAPATPDPFAPFLQNWLGSSPVRGQFFDQFAGKPDSGGGTTSPGDYRGPTGAGGGPVAPAEVASTEKVNPYLVEMNAPLLPKEMTQEAPQLQSLGAPVPAPEPGKGGPVLLPSDPAPDSRERGKPALPGLADEKKYFPQLKRF